MSDTDRVRNRQHVGLVVRKVMPLVVVLAFVVARRIRVFAKMSLHWGYIHQNPTRRLPVTRMIAV